MAHRLLNFVLGTAAFNPAGYANLPPVSLPEIRRILSCAKEGGIHMIDTADAYRCHGIIKQEAKGFSIYTKTRDWKIDLDWGENELRGILYHYKQDEAPVELPFIHRWLNLGMSIYTQEQLPTDKQRILQVPLNLLDWRFANIFDSYRTIFIRSVFGRGDLLKKYSLKECLDFVKTFRADGVIVGVRSAKELEQILKA